MKAFDQFQQVYQENVFAATVNMPAKTESTLFIFKII